MHALWVWKGVFTIIAFVPLHHHCLMKCSIWLTSGFPLQSCHRVAYARHLDLKLKSYIVMPSKNFSAAKSCKQLSQHSTILPQIHWLCPDWQRNKTGIPASADARVVRACDSIMPAWPNALFLPRLLPSMEEPVSGTVTCGKPCKFILPRCTMGTANPAQCKCFIAQCPLRWCGWNMAA